MVNSMYTCDAMFVVYKCAYLDRLFFFDVASEKKGRSGYAILGLYLTIWNPYYTGVSV